LTIAHRATLLGLNPTLGHFVRIVQHGTREYLTPAGVERLVGAARCSRHRDATLILISSRQALRASEVADLEWSQVEIGRNATLHVRRSKNGKPTVLTH